MGTPDVHGQDNNNWYRYSSESNSYVNYRIIYKWDWFEDGDVSQFYHIIKWQDLPKRIIIAGKTIELTDEMLVDIPRDKRLEIVFFVKSNQVIALGYRNYSNPTLKALDEAHKKSLQVLETD